jgi:hypothetical protein
VDLQQLIAAMARANATWGEERIAAELQLKLGISVSFLIHDRDSIYAAAVDDAVTAMGVTVLKAPVRCP